MNKICALKNIIKTKNPFLNALQAWRREMDEFNASKGETKKPQFVLKEDEESIDKYQKQHEGTVWKLHFELLPDAFRGDPRAPVWILLLNPGYSEVDLYDHLGLCPICGKRLVRTDGKRTSHKYDCVARCFGGNLKNASNALKLRQDLMLDELNLDLSKRHDFFWFNECFDTVSPDVTMLAGKGGHLWWKEFLFGSRDENSDKYILPKCGIKDGTPNLSSELGKRIFALELFPYHSSHFGSRFVYLKAYKQSPYFELWGSLVKWAVEANKILIVRYAAVRDALKYVLGDNVYDGSRGNILNMASIYPSLTYGNLCGKKMKNSKVAVNNLYASLTNHAEC